MFKCIRGLAFKLSYLFLVCTVGFDLHAMYAMWRSCALKMKTKQANKTHIFIQFFHFLEVIYNMKQLVLLTSLTLVYNMLNFISSPISKRSLNIYVFSFYHSFSSSWSVPKISLAFNSCLFHKPFPHLQLQPGFRGAR